MPPLSDNTCGRIGTKVSLLCATLAIAGPFGFVLLYAQDFLRYSVRDKLISLGAGLFIGVVFYVAAALLGKAAGKTICRKDLKLGGSILVGIILAFSSLVVAAVVVDVAIFVAKGLAGQLEAPGLLTILIIAFGAIPAILLGVVYGILMRWRLGRLRVSEA